MTLPLEDRIQRILEITETHERMGRQPFEHINFKLVTGLLEMGVSMQNIAKIYGCIPYTITKYMKKENPDFDARNYFIPHRQDITTEKLAKAYKKLGTCPKVAKQFGIDRSTVSQRLKRAGIKVNWPNRFDVPTSQVIALYSIFKNTQYVGEILGMDRSAIRLRLKRVGISTKRDRDSARKFKGKPIPKEEVLERYPYDSIHTIASDYHVPDWRIRAILKENRIKIPKYRTRSDIPTKEVIRLYVEEDKNIEDISKKYNSSYYTIKKILDKGKVHIKNPVETMHKRKYDLRELVDEFRSGTNIILLSKKYGLSPSIITHDLREAGEKVTYSTIPKKYHKKIIAAYKTEQNLEPIARNFGMQPLAIKRVLILNNVPLRDHSSDKRAKIEKLNLYFKKESKLGKAQVDTKIAQELNINWWQINNYRFEFGIPGSSKRGIQYQQKPRTVYQIHLE